MKLCLKKEGEVMSWNVIHKYMCECKYKYVCIYIYVIV